MQIHLDCEGYLYKGSINSDITLESYIDGEVEIHSSYGERMATVHTWKEMRKFMADLLTDKYAE